MSPSSSSSPGPPPPAGPLRRWRWLAVASVAATFGLVVLGGVVRITGSGMGCGDDWPLCNGQLLPPLDFPTLVEYGHRLVAAAVSVLVLGLTAHAWRPGRNVAAWRPYRRLSLLALGLLGAQVMLGAVTVWLELPPASVILHLGTAMLLLAVLVAGSLRAGSRRGRRPADGLARGSWLLAGFAFLVVLAGALVANLDAAAACLGFPLCGGEWWPSGGWRVQVQWGHRLVAYGLVAVAVLLPAGAGRRRAGDAGLRRATWIAAGLVVAQVAVGALMVTGRLTLGLRATHLALGAAVFMALVAVAWLASHGPGAAAGSGREPGGGEERGARRARTEGARGSAPDASPATNPALGSATNPATKSATNPEIP